MFYFWAPAVAASTKSGVRPVFCPVDGAVGDGWRKGVVYVMGIWPVCRYGFGQLACQGWTGVCYTHSTQIYS